MKTFAIIVAGGSGSRMKATTPKQFLLLKGKPVIYYTIKAFIEALSHVQLIVVLPKEHLEFGQKIVADYFKDISVQFAIGGETRFHSVQNGLKCVEENSMVMVHDAVRCLVAPQLIQHCLSEALQFGSAIPVIDSKDSIRMLTDDGSEVVDRKKIKLVQTPQVFESNILLKAVNNGYRESFTDDASVVEANGLKVHLVKGEDNNIKITHPADLIIAEHILQMQ